MLWYIYQYSRILWQVYNEKITTIVSSIAAAVTGPPQNVRNTARSSTTLSISWSPPLITQRYGTILRYNVSCLGSGVLQFHQTTDNSTRMVGLHPYTHYSCCISAITTMAEGTRACLNTRTLETGKNNSMSCISNLLKCHRVTCLLLFLSTHCCSPEYKRYCNWLHLTVSILEPPTFPVQEW